MTQKHPTVLPDHMVRKIADAAAEHGYGVARLTLQWETEDLDAPPIARVEYDAYATPETERSRASRWQRGDRFTVREGETWMVTDVGSRTVTAARVYPSDPATYAGPPYAVGEVVFDENDQDVMERVR